MNKIKKAITEIEQSGLYGNQVHQETLETALAALREKAEREKGCKICTAGYGEFTVKYLKWNDYKFCPMCGRKLEESK
jgi:hypothetical protein